MNRDVIIACDFASKEQTVDFISKFDGYSLISRSVWSFFTPKALR